MSVPILRFFTEASGNTIFAAHYNGEFDNIIDNGLIPAGIAGASGNQTAMQATANPGGVGTESLAGDLLGEIQRLRFAIKAISGEAQWYVAPSVLLNQKLSAAASSTDRAVAKFSGTSGNTLINSGVIIDDSNNVSGIASLTAGTAVNEVQTITPNHIPTGGTFTVTFGISTSAAINWNDSAATVQTALQAMGSIGSGNIAVALDGTTKVYTLTFQGTLAGQNVAQVTVASSLTYASGSVTLTVATTTQGSTGISTFNTGVVFAGTSGHVATADIANAMANARTRSAAGATVGLGGVAYSGSSGNFSTTSTSLTDVTNLSCTITTSGRPVFVGLIPDQSTTNPGRLTWVPGVGNWAVFAILNGSTVISIAELGSAGDTSGNAVPPGSVFAVDFPAAGTYTYKLQARVQSSGTAGALYCRLVAYEL